jgi:hypothetical protein
MLHRADPQTQNLELALYESAVHCPALLWSELLLLLLLLLLSLLLSCPVRHLLRLVLGAAAAAAAPPPQLVPLPLMSVINGWLLEDAIEKALRKRTRHTATVRTHPYRSTVSVRRP